MNDFNLLPQDSFKTTLAQTTKGLFVGDLSSSTTERDLQILFGAIDKVVAVEVKRGRHGDSLLHGFVEFDKEESAFCAIQTLNGLKFKGRKMRVNWTNTKVSSNPEIESWVQVQVNFLSKNTSSQVNEELLETIFSQFGPIGDVMVKRQVLSSDPAQVSGYGFIYFVDVASAINAISLVKGISIDGVIYECVVGAQTKDEKKLRNITTSQGTNAQQHFPASAAKSNNKVYHANTYPASAMNAGGRFPIMHANMTQQHAPRLNLNSHSLGVTSKSLSSSANINVPMQNMRSTRAQHLYANHANNNAQYSSSYPQQRGDDIVVGNYHQHKHHIVPTSSNQSRPRTLSEQQQQPNLLISMKPNILLNSQSDSPYSECFRKSLFPPDPPGSSPHPHFHLQQQHQQPSTIKGHSHFGSLSTESNPSVDEEDSILNFSFAQNHLLNQQQQQQPPAPRSANFQNVNCISPSLLSFIHDHSSSLSSHLSPSLIGSDLSEHLWKLQSPSFDSTNTESVSSLKLTESQMQMKNTRHSLEEERYLSGLKQRSVWTLGGF